MITKINKMKDFGIFKNFENDGTVPEFKNSILFMTGIIQVKLCFQKRLDV